MDSDIRYFIQEINNECYVLVYENNIKNPDESFLKKKYENEIVDFIITKEYDEIKNVTKFEIFNKDDCLNLENIFHDLVDGKYFLLTVNKIFYHSLLLEAMNYILLLNILKQEKYLF